MMGAIVQAREGSGIGMTPEERAILKIRINRIFPATRSSPSADRKYRAGLA
jgi:hypothetical protein